MIMEGVSRSAICRHFVSFVREIDGCEGTLREHRGDGRPSASPPENAKSCEPEGPQDLTARL
jgi:hypothetical protein